MKRVLGLALLAFLLVGCEAEKIPIAGTRVSVVNYESTVKVDADTKDLTVRLPLSEMGRDWPQAGGSADHVMPHFSMENTLTSLWTTSIGYGNGAGRILSTPVVSEGYVYALDTYGNVTAIDTSSGEVIWETSVAKYDTPFIGGGLACGEGKVFVTSPHAEVLALEAKSGRILWRYVTPSPVRASPTLSEGRLYVLTISNQLEVLDVEQGTSLWSHAGITEYAGLLGTASPAVARGVVIVAYSSGEIYALKAENGHQLWTETLSATRRPDSLSALAHIKALPVVSGNTVVVIGHNQKMAAYDLRRGEKLWERHIGGTRTPAVLGNYIFMLDSHNELVCLTLKHGQVVWVRKFPLDPEEPHKIMWEGPLVAGGKLYLASLGGDIVTVDPMTGSVLNSRQTGASFACSPFAAQEIIYLLTQNGDVMALR